MQFRVVPHAFILSVILLVSLGSVTLAQSGTIDLVVSGLNCDQADYSYTQAIIMDSADFGKTGVTYPVHIISYSEGLGFAKLAKPKTTTGFYLIAVKNQNNETIGTTVSEDSPTSFLMFTKCANGAVKDEEQKIESISGPTANRSANLRSGPGTNYAVAGGVKAGQALQIVGKNQDGSWLKLADGKWIAAFLVNNVPGDLPVEAASAPEPVPTTVAASTPVPQQPTQQTANPVDWRSASAQVCGDFEWKVVDVRRTKETWHYDEKTVARGQYLIVYVEIKNVGPGTSDLESSSAPRLNGRRYDFDPSWDAAWMMTGGHNVTWNDYNPGEVITVVAGFDVQPGDSHTFGMANCGQSVNIGAWDQVVEGVIRAS